MSASLHETRKLLAVALKGERPEESLVRSALAEVNAFSADVVEVAPGEQPVQPQLAVTADEVLAALVPLFNVMETLVIDLRAKVGGRLLLSTAMSNAYLDAVKVLKKAGHEPVKHRRAEPLTFIPVTHVRG